MDMNKIVRFEKMAFKWMKILLAVLFTMIIILGILIIRTPSVPHLVKKSTAGEFGVAYNLNPAGAFQIENLDKIHKNDQASFGGQIVENTVVIEVVGDFYNIQTYLEENAYFTLYDENFQNETRVDTAVYRSQEENKLYIILDSSKSIQDKYYMVMAGLGEKNPNTKLLFPIDEVPQDETEKKKTK